MNKPVILLAVSAALATATWAARQDGTPKAADAAAKPKVPAVTGRVVYDGKPPEATLLKVDADKSVGCCPAGESVSTKDPTLLIDAKGGLQNCVVTIQVDGAKVEPAKEPYVIDQKGCHFEPHVVLATLGSKVVFLNSDQCTHNVHTYARKSEGMNKALASGGKEVMLLEHREVVRILCDYHPWMSSYVFVTDTPFAALTGADGSFEITGLKPGTYKGEVWHEQIGKLKFDVTVADDGSAALGDLKMAHKKKG
jgi:plastocyanin